MYKKIILYFLFFFAIYNYYIFFDWYLSDEDIIIEHAFYLSLKGSITMFVFILLTHIFFYPKKNSDNAKVISFPPIIWLFSINSAIFIGSLNRYYLQIYNLPDFLDIFRNWKIGLLVCFIAIIIISLALQEFNNNSEDPIPTTPSTMIIKNNMYKFTRNPMYLGLIILQIGIGMSLSYVHIILFSMLTFIIFRNYVIIPEEVYLEEKFENNYLDYKKNIRRWF